MLLFLPRLHQDELLYGSCARYHRRSGNISPKDTMRDLFGTSSATAVIDLPSRLDHLSRQLPPGTLNTADKLIFGHTLLPLYRPFLPPKRYQKLVVWMKGSSNGGCIHETIGAMASGIPLLQHLRWCPACVARDTQELGESYWHRSHQVTGVSVCHQHGVWLRQNDQLLVSERNQHFFQPAPVAGPQSQSCMRPTATKHQLNLAEAVAYVLNTPEIPALGLEWLHKRYVHFLKAADLASYTGRIAQRDLRRRFVAFYGTGFLEETHSTVDANSEETWLSSLVRKPRKATHPLRHLLLIMFLGLEPEDFFSANIGVEKRPFGRGPWPCLNPVCPHFRKSVIIRCTVTRHSENGKPIGAFRCSCGYRYARTGPDTNRDDRSRVGRVLDFGELWEAELQRLAWDKTVSLRESARRLGVDPNTVKKHLYGDRTKQMTPPVMDMDQVRQVRRCRWLELCGANPGAGRSEIRVLDPGSYTWLYRHDRDWLFSHPPEKELQQSGYCRVNWPARDEQLADDVVTGAKEIRGIEGRPIRITVSAIGKRLGREAYLQKHLVRLPMTQVVLPSVVETDEEYAVRRVRYAVKKILEAGESMQHWRVVREARLRPGYAPLVEREIRRAVEMSLFPGRSN